MPYSVIYSHTLRKAGAQSRQHMFFRMIAPWCFLDIMNIHNLYMIVTRWARGFCGEWVLIGVWIEIRIITRWRLLLCEHELDALNHRLYILYFRHIQQCLLRAAMQSDLFCNYTFFRPVLKGSSLKISSLEIYRKSIRQSLCLYVDS